MTTRASMLCSFRCVTAFFYSDVASEFLTSGTSKNRAAKMRNPADVPCRQRSELVGDQAGVSTLNSKNFRPTENCPPSHRPDGRIHAGASPPLVRTAIRFMRSE